MLDVHWVEVGLLALSYVVMAMIYVTGGKSATRILANKLEFLDATMEDFKLEMKKLQEVIILQAVQTNRLDTIDRRLTNISQTLDQRVMLQGRRTDELERRVFNLPPGTWKG